MQIFWRCWPKEGASLRIVGLAGSPSCGVITTSSGYTGGLPHMAEHAHVSGWGAFVAEPLARLEMKRGTFCG